MIIAPAEAQAGGALQLPDPVLDVVQVDHRDALEPGGIGAAELGEPVVVGAKDRGHQRRVRHLEVKQPLRGIEDFAGHPVERHVLEVLLGVVPAAEHVFEAPLGGDRLGGLEPRAGVRDQADPGEDLIRLDHDMVAAVDPLDPRRPIAERRIDAGLPQIGRFEHVRVGRENQGQHRHLLSHLIAGSTFGNRPIAVKASAVGSRQARLTVHLCASDQDRREGRAPRPLHHVPDGRDRSAAADVPAHPVAHSPGYGRGHPRHDRASSFRCDRRRRGYALVKV